MKKLRVLFISWHFYLDGSNGASISARELLLGLRQRGWDVKTLCGPIVDNPDVSDVVKTLNSHGILARKEIEEKGKSPFAVFSFNDSGIRSVVFVPNNASFNPSRSAGENFLGLAAASLARIKPDIIITYGGSWLEVKLLQIVKSLGIKSVFMLQNFAYRDKKLFELIDRTIVPSQFASDSYRKKLGIKTVPIPPLIDDQAVKFKELPDEKSKKYVLYVNPSANKGVFLFVKIAQELWKKRSDIPFLVVEGCSTSGSLFATGADLRGVNNINLMSNTTRPSDFYRYAKITLVPSVFNESFGRVAAESMMVGIPVIGSNRGSLPETIGEAGALLHINERYQPETRIIPNADEVVPWIDEIIRLWDDSYYYVERRDQCLCRSAKWSYSRVLDEYETCLKQVLLER